MTRPVLLDPKMDFIFKKLMEDTVLLKDFLKSVLCRSEGEITSVELINPQTKKEFIKDKYSYLDVRVKTADGRVINVEIQKKDEKNMTKRTLFHWSKMYGEEIIEGENYRKLPKTICVNILDFDYLETEDGFHHIYRLLHTESKNELRESTIEIHFIELKKFDAFKDKSENEALKAWINFLNSPESSVNVENATIKKAVQTLEILSGDEETITLYKQRKDALDEGKRQLNSKFSEGLEKGLEKGIAQGIEKGIEQGIEKGIEQGIYNSILSVLKFMNDEQIAVSFNKTVEEIRDIRKRGMS